MLRARARPLHASSISSSLRICLTSAAFLAYGTEGSAQMALMVFWRSTTPRKTSARFDDVASATRSEEIFLVSSASFASRLLFLSLGKRAVLIRRLRRTNVAS